MLYNKRATHLSINVHGVKPSSKQEKNISMAITYVISKGLWIVSW